MSDESSFKRTLLVVLFVLLACIIFGLFWFFFLGPAVPVGLGWYLFSFTAGLSMIVLPCTLPLAFVIVPLSMGKGPFKGFMIALFFGMGVAFTLSLYGVLAAVLGKFAIGSLGAPLEVVKNWLYFIAGAFAYLFALGELGLIKFRMPTYSGAFPAFIQKQQDVLKALLLGLFLGNIGVGCPHPATPVILTRIAVSGDVFYGWLLFFVHAVGRVLPLIFLAILGILGVNALAGLVTRKAKIERATGWAMVFVAGFILVLGLFSHDWWVLSGMHTLLEGVTQEHVFLTLTANKIGSTVVHEHGIPPVDHTGLFGLPLALGTWAMLFLWILPLFWYYGKRRKEVSALADPQKETESRTLPYLFWNAVTLSLLLIAVFGYALPNRFLTHAQGHDMEQEHMMMDEGHEHAETMLHEEKDVRSGIAVNLAAFPASPAVGAPATFEFFVNMKPGNDPIPESALEVAHEKKMHVIGVRNDLKEFFHIHPAPSAVPGVFSVNHAFEKPGDYKVWSEVKYEGVNHAFGHPLLSVSGDGATREPRSPITTSVITGNYQVLLHYDQLGIGDNHLDFEIRNAQGEAANLSDYLGEKMHLAVISEDLTQFIHAHPDSGDHGMMMDHGDGHTDHTHPSFGIPEAHADTGHDHAGLDPNHLGFTVPMTKPGFYKVFAQFQPADSGLSGDEYLLGEFWIEVSSAEAAASPSTPATPGNSTWWRNLIVSLFAIGILSWVVKKFITV